MTHVIKTPTINVMNPGHLNQLAKYFDKLGRTLASSETRSAVSEPIADYVRDRASRIVADNNAFESLDGNKIDSVETYKTPTGRWGVRMKSPWKSNADHPDAYYIEYGYGRTPAGWGAKALSSGRKLNAQGYWPKPISPSSPNIKVASTDPWGGMRAGREPVPGQEVWFYRDVHGGLMPHSLAAGDGFTGIAPMYRATSDARKHLKNPGSRLRKRIDAAMARVLPDMERL